ncbi:hypothetical protein ACWEV3_40930 [Saccharopolyspora sp. NPDC003752]
MTASTAIALYAAIIATYAALVSTGILVWQIASWRRSGHVVRVRGTFMQGPVFDDDGTLVAYDYDFLIGVSNTGRESITITGIGIRTDRPTGQKAPHVRRLFAEPVVLEGGHQDHTELVTLSFDEFEQILSSKKPRVFAESAVSRFDGERIDSKTNLTDLKLYRIDDPSAQDLPAYDKRASGSPAEMKFRTASGPEGPTGKARYTDYIGVYVR